MYRYMHVYLSIITVHVTTQDESTCICTLDSGSDPPEDCDTPLTESRQATVKSRKAACNRTNPKGGMLIIPT